MIGKEPWQGYIEPFCLWGNIYFVGTIPASTHIVDTGDGLIMFDCGYQESLYLMLENMRRIGLDPAKVTDVFVTHGHVDHCGAAEAFRRLFGAKIWISEIDAPYVRGTTAQDMTWAREYKMHFISFEPDGLLHDGDVITRGNTTIRCVATPGHTPGATSFIFNATDGARTVIAGLHGGAGMNSLAKKYLEENGLPLSLQKAFRDSMERLLTEHVDIYLGNHAAQNGTPKKLERIKNGEPDAFLDSGSWGRYITRCIAAIDDLVAKEQA
ncbi:MAG: MBL fold metallo-hydrolase [Clostridia bacterium]|nr:MBL fold metallo-hydrolase [Clostridia bacterium]